MKQSSFRANLTTALTQKALMQELQFLNSACHLILVDICMKIHEDNLRAFQVVERTRLRCNLVMVEVPWEITQKSINARVMVLALCMPSNAG